MIKRYVFGRPIDTEAVVLQLEVQHDKIPYFESNQGEHFSLTYIMNEDTQIFGLGENVRGMNKRGFIYESQCSDDPSHDEGKRSLYGAHNFILVKGEKTFGVFIDFPGNITFDLGYSNKDIINLIINGNDFSLYIIEGASLLEITRAFRQLIGQSYIPPKWAFGYQQSRWSYKNEQEVLEVAEKHRELGLPLDAIYLDIDYMENYKDFTVSKEAFPDLRGLSDKLKKMGIRLVPIIDAGVKIEKGYPIYEEGVAQNYFCKDDQGEDFVAAVWPGKVHFPDFLNENTRKWFGEKYKILLDEGIEGFWNDMNEPAIFYSEKGLRDTFNEIDKIKQIDNMGIQECFYLKDLVNGISNSPKDYSSFYHRYHGEKIRHDQVHNLYGYYMTRAAGEALNELEPDKRILLFSRASYIGMHRYGGIWTGDNKSWWSHLLMNIQMMPNLNMCGFLYSGADLGGFGDHATEDLVLRWLEFGLFTPLMRNHAAMGTRNQEVYAFSQTESFKRILDIRYGLLPYIYSEYMKAVLHNEMYFRPLAFDYEEDLLAAEVEDQLLVGKSMMIAPIYRQNAKGRYVYLPEEMLMIKFTSLEKRIYKIMEKGHHYIQVALDEVVCFIKCNHVVPIGKTAASTGELQETQLELCGFVREEATYQLYQDDGFTKDYLNANHLTNITVKQTNGKTELITDQTKVSFELNLFS